MSNKQICAFLIFFASIAQAVDIFSKQPLSDIEPPWNAQDHSSPPGDLFDPHLLEKPVPTNTWWLNLGLGTGSNRVNVLPYQIMAKNDGFHICYPNNVIDVNYVASTFLDNLVFSSASGLGSKTVEDWDELSVTIKWSGNGGSLRTPLVRGMAYVTMLYSQSKPTMSTIHAILNVNGQAIGGGLSLSGTKFTFEMNNGQKWRMWTSDSVTINFNGNGFNFASDFSGSIRVAICPNDAAAEILDQHAGSIPIGGSKDGAIRATSNGDSATYSFNFATSGSGQLLMMTLPHHRQIIDQSILRNEINLESLKGNMIGAVGDVWTMTEPLTTITWGAPRPIRSDREQDIRDALYADQGLGVYADDTYFGGKQMATLARLALIADELGEASLADTYRTNLKASIEPWLQNNGKLVRDRSWGGIVDSLGINDPGANFGMGFYNDHHFHFGYFVYAAAVIAKEDPEWTSTYGDAVLSLIRDFANPATHADSSPDFNGDPYFPFMRNKDWFVGHSWAAGIFEFADARNQESTSESVNAWYAVSLYGLAIGNDRIRDLGRLALATEIRSTQLYWQINDADDIYPSPFADRKVVGILWGTKVDYATFFGANTEFVHCIQMLPFTPITEELLDPDWIREEYQILQTAIGSAVDGWKGFIYMAHAIIDPEAAWAEVQSLGGYDDGNSKTNTLYWVATRP